MTILPKQMLAIGSVVKLKGSDKRVMIYGTMQVAETGDKIYDYVGVMYPEGNVNAEEHYFFEHTDIERIDFYGFTDIERQDFVDSFHDTLTKMDI